MNTESHAPGGSGPGPAPRGAAGPPEARGRTDISDRVLERIAAHAVSEVDQVGGAAAPRPLGRATPGAAPRVSAHADGRLAIVRVRMSVTYPAPIRQVVHRVRDHVAARVHELTGLDARQVDIDVTRLVHPAEEGRRVL
ncbi:Asp23/Gls24 family envelope stress response protein [Sphaerisporangium sp. NPDC049002]|uniref:Asp23/Gls24 family envelope stress response protein n=1 Tax=unclassified Sphaerisporangium TaxID=2630420 RepID=UPI0034036A52